MKYKVLKNTVAGGVRVSAGAVVELNQREAYELLGYGRIMPFDETEVTTNVVDDIIHRDPVVKTRGRKPKNGL